MIAVYGHNMNWPIQIDNLENSQYDSCLNFLNFKLVILGAS